MARIGFIGLGNMGLPMAQNLLKAGHAVAGFDLNAEASERLTASGGIRANSAAEVCRDAEIVITMLPAGEHVRDVYLGDAGVLAAAAPATLLINSSTIDVETSRAVAQAAEGRGLPMVDAPVSGGVAGAQAATLTFMVGGSSEAFERARPVLENMGKTIVHAGGPGTGQAAEDLQQYDPGRIDDRGFGGLPAGGKAGPRRPAAFRHCVEVVGPMLVDDELLPGAGAGADVAREPRLSGRLHRGDDAQGLEAGAICRPRHPRHDPARRRRGRGL